MQPVRPDWLRIRKEVGNVEQTIRVGNYVEQHGDHRHEGGEEGEESENQVELQSSLRLHCVGVECQVYRYKVFRV